MLKLSIVESLVTNKTQKRIVSVRRLDGFDTLLTVTKLKREL